MSGLILRRIVAVVAALTWPACRILETITHPWWGTRLSDALAPLVAMVILALVLTSPAAHRRSAKAWRPRHARTAGLSMELMVAQLLHMSGRIADLHGRMERAEERQAQAEADREVTEARLGCAIQVINEANQVAGLPAPDVDGTMPGTGNLRVVRLGVQRQAG